MDRESNRNPFSPKEMPNLNIPIRYLQIIHLGGEAGELCLVNIVTEFKNPSKGPNAPETIEFSSILPRRGIEGAMKNLVTIHGHGKVIEIHHMMLDENGFEIPYEPDVSGEKL